LYVYNKNEMLDIECGSSGITTLEGNQAQQKGME
jgi:hypothetical protein